MKDKRIKKLIKLESKRLKKSYNLIASENIPSKDVLESLGSWLTVKYSEGEIKKRFYNGNNNIDEIEKECKNRLLKLFNCEKKYVANVQVTSGSIANLCVYLAFLNFGDKILSLDLKSGSHITHGLNVNFSGKFYKIINYNLNKSNLLDYKEIERIAIKEKPKIIIVGFTNYSRQYSFKKLYRIAKKSSSLLMVDASHIIGIIAAKECPSPIGFCDILTSTTQKTLRGPRSAFILVKKQYEEQLNKAVFPGCLGGPKNNEIAAKAICFKEASTLKFKSYIKKVLENTKYLCEECKKLGFKIVSGGTDNHLFCIDLSSSNIDGRTFANELEKNGIIVNANTIPNDKGTSFNPQGVRLGCALETSKGITKKELDFIANKMHEILNKLMNKNGKK